MSQLFSLYNDLTIEENIDFFSGLYSVPESRKVERREWVLEIARLTDQRSRQTGELPLGFKQRLALGCAVLHEPPILFLDEPTSGVDPTSRRSFWDLIYSLTESGTTVFVTTHYMEEAEYCHRLALMNRGRLIAVDTPDRLRGKMSYPLLEIQSDNSMETVRLLQSLPVVLEVGMFGRALHVTVSDEGAARSEITKCLSSHNINLLGLRRIQASLEDIFVYLVKEEGGAPDG
jgi:ABC-2 type transport system ATP-binding protein